MKMHTKSIVCDGLFPIDTIPSPQTLFPFYPSDVLEVHPVGKAGVDEGSFGNISIT